MDPVEMLAAYELERQGTRTEIEPGKGFATWKLLFDPSIGEAAQGQLAQQPPPRDAYLVDIFVAPEYRKNGVAGSLAERVSLAAKALGANRLVGTVDTGARTRATAMLAMLSYGFEFDRVDGSLLVFTRGIA
jgi:GNAT superfamily N-acetyltransferase